MLADRKVSPDAAFRTALLGGERARRQAEQHGVGPSTKGSVSKSTITKGAAEQALRGLDPRDVEQVGAVQRFLDGKDAKALSPAARAILLAFVEAQHTQLGGTSVVEARRTGARDAVAEARARVLTLVQHGSTPEETRARYAKVSAWLDAAEADLAQAGARLAGLGADKQGPTASKVAGQGSAQLAVLLGGKHRGVGGRVDVAKGDVEAVRRWLAKPVLPRARLEVLRRTFERLDRAGTLSWTPGGVAEHHRGVRFAKVELSRERHADGFTFTAWIPLGALTPGGRAREPGAVGEFYVERTGGLAGLTLSVGPLGVTGADRQG